MNWNNAPVQGGRPFFLPRMVAMKSMHKELWFNIPTQRGFVNITLQVEACLKESGIREGLALINAKHMKFGCWLPS